jgi:hypothetical protein
MKTRLYTKIILLALSILATGILPAQSMTSEFKNPIQYSISDFSNSYADTIQMFMTTDRFFVLGARKINMNRLFLPSNLMKEKKRFLENLRGGKIIEPRFEYLAAGSPMKYARINLNMIRSLLAMPEPVNPLSMALRKLYRIKIAATTKKATFLAHWTFEHCLENKSGEDTEQNSIRESAFWKGIYPLFRQSDSETLSKAQRWLDSLISRSSTSTDNRVDNSRENNETTLDYREMTSRIHGICRSLGMKNVKVIHRDVMASRISVSPMSRKVSIRKDARFSQDAVKRLAIHEIGVHMTRAVNGSRMLPGLGILTQGSDPVTEEGMAKYMERVMGVNEEGRDHKFLLLYLASRIGREMTFSELFGWLKERLTAFVQPGKLNEEAFAMSVRLRRGIASGLAKGIYPKDGAYFQGYSEILDLLGDPHTALNRENSKKTIALLLSGKWSQEELQIAGEMKKSAPDQYQSALIGPELIEKMIRKLNCP